MNNAAIAQVFQDMADLLELKEENPFKIRAYERAAHTITSLPTELEHVAREGRLREIPGIGEAIASKITELLATGRLGAYEKLRAEFPETIGSLMSVPGVGPKIAGRVYKELGISTVEELEKAILDGRFVASHIKDNIDATVGFINNPLSVILVLCDINADIGAHLTAYIQIKLGHSQIIDSGSADRLRYATGKGGDRSIADNGDLLSGDITFHDGKNGVAEWFLDTGNLDRHRFFIYPAIYFGNGVERQAIYYAQIRTVRFYNRRSSY